MPGEHGAGGPPPALHQDAEAVRGGSPVPRPAQRAPGGGRVLLQAQRAAGGPVLHGEDDIHQVQPRQESHYVIMSRL